MGGPLTATVTSRAALLKETSEHHDPYEKSHAPHNWWDWYAAYLDEREKGQTPDEAAPAGGPRRTGPARRAAPAGN